MCASGRRQVSRAYRRGREPWSPRDEHTRSDESKALNDGAITFPNFAVESLLWRVYARWGVFDNDMSVGKHSSTKREHLLRVTGLTWIPAPTRWPTTVC